MSCFAPKVSNLANSDFETLVRPTMSMSEKPLFVLSASTWLLTSFPETAYLELRMKTFSFLGMSILQSKASPEVDSPGSIGIATVIYLMVKISF